MDNVYFLITDLIGAHDGSHTILHSLTCPQINAQAFVFVRDFIEIKELREEFPSATFILLDLGKNVDVNKQCIRLLPEIDCFLNYTGQPFSNLLNSLKDFKFAKDIEVVQHDITIETICLELKRTENPGAVLINIVEHEEIGSKLCNVFNRETLEEEAYGPSSGTPSSSSSIQLPMRPKSFQAFPHSSQSPHLTESRPLLARNQSRQEEPGFLSCLFCFCYPYCCSSAESNTPEFASPEQLQRHIRMEQTTELRERLEKLFETSDSDWDKISKQLQEKENNKLEELVIKIEDRKILEEAELNRQKDEQNAATETNLSDVLDKKVIEKIKESRERHVKKKVGWDLDVSYNEGAMRIRRAAQMELIVKTDEHYSKVLLKQFEILSNVNEKYKRKYERLSIQHFGKVIINI